VTKRLEADVCVVGAGFAGLSAAWRLHQAGNEVVVLEARDRVGGRSWTEYLPDGTQIDRGCGWIGAGQDRSYKLAAEMEVGTYPTWAEGEHVLMKNGKPTRYTGTVPLRINALQLANIGIAMTRLNQMAKKVPPEAPWTAKNASDWDNRTLRDWLESATAPGAGREMLQASLGDLFTSDLAEVSLLGALHLLNSNEGFEHLVNIKGGHQEARVVGGTQAILNRVHERLGDAVRLSAPVHAVSQSGDGVKVRSADVTVKARRAVVAVPVWLTERIWWDPPLPRDRAQLIQRVPTGEVWKFHFVYDSPWWREEGLSGQSLDTTSYVPVTLDACGPEPPPGVLFGVCGGRESRELAKLTPDARRELLVRELTARFGPKAGRLQNYIEQDWTAEGWSRGGMTTHFPPGVLTSLGHALRPASGRVHWAGTETAVRFMGTFDGAIESGDRAADEILAVE
jgi:monoamine oxidase